jgi:outer membrane protein OmpA-like peptidoglycan-associated protein
MATALHMRRNDLVCRLLPIFVVLFALVPRANAESGRLNLHLDFGTGGALAGDTRRPDRSEDAAVGGMFGLGFDYVIARPLALELMLYGGGVAHPFATEDQTGAGIIGFGAGVRLRPLDDGTGYATEEHGNVGGNLFVAAHIGFYRFDGPQPAFDVSVGYEFSVTRPLSIGPFARMHTFFGGDSNGVDVTLFVGVSAQIEIMSDGHGADTDGDGLPDGEEAEHGTDPARADTDHDGINDRIEVRSGTNPLENDTDHDGLLDGREDGNHNGEIDAGETDPRLVDTDGGGISDTDEIMQEHTNPRDPLDDDLDQDGVGNIADLCPAAPGDRSPNSNGCPDRAARMQIPGATFSAGRSRLEETADVGLGEARAVLARNTSRYEIRVHVPASGDAAADLALSQRRAEAVLSWFAQHEIDRARLTAVGAGSAEPMPQAAPDAPTNARVELVRVD